MDTKAADKAPPTVEEPNFLNIEDILNHNELATLDVEVPDWGKNGKPGVIRLRQLSAEEAVAFGETQKTPAAQNTSNIRLVMLSAVKPGTGNPGKPLFDNPAMLGALQKKSVRAWNKLSDAALALNGFTKASAEAIKNGSGETVPAVSPTDSPQSSGG
jgi:hypothetical protein